MKAGIFPFAAAPCLLVALTLTLAAPAQAQLQPPELVEEVSPSWPPGHTHEQDVVVAIVLTVAKDGTVAHVETPVDLDPALARAAEQAAQQFVFRPATRDGAPVAARVRAQVRFHAETTPTVEPEPTAPGPPPSPQSRPQSGGATSSAAPTPTFVTQAPPSATGAAPESAEVTILGRAVPPPTGTSDLRIEVGELARVPRKNATQLLTLAPGVFLSNEGGEGHPERIYLRGFDAREGQDIEFSVGGVPINESGNLHGNGVADPGFIIPELVTNLRVLEGPFDPRQGNYAVAGSANYELGLARRGLTAKGTLGSFGTERVLLTWGPENASRGTFAGAELFKTDGFGQNRDARRARAMAQYEGALGRDTSIRLAGAAYGTEYHSAGLLRVADVESGRVGFYDTYDPLQGGNGSRFHAAADVETKNGDTTFFQQFFVIARHQRVRENFTGFLLDTQQATQNLHGQRGDLFDLAVDESTYGARGFGRSTLNAFGQRQQLELGYFARGDTVTSMRQRIEAASGVPYKTDTNLESQLGDFGLYGEVVLRPVKFVALNAGARADLFLFDVLDRCAVQNVSHPSDTNSPVDQSCLSQQRFGVHREPEQRSSTAGSKVMPRATLTLGPFSHVTYSLSYGSGVRSIDPSYVTQDVATPFASIAALDGGAMYAHDFGDLNLAVRSTFFGTHVDRDVVFSETEGRNVLGGGTTRVGWNGLARVRGPFYDSNANIALVRSTFDDTHLLVPYAPDLVARSDSAFFFALPTRLANQPLTATLSAGLGYVGHRALPYGQRTSVIFTADAGASLRWDRLELGLDVTNLFDNQYRAAEYYYPSDFNSAPAPTLVPARHFAAGAPRQIFVSLTIGTLGG